MSKILNQAQAEAVYSAMCELNNVGGRLSCIDLGELQRDPQVRCMEYGAVIIGRGTPFFDSEMHDSQSAFAAAYGLQ